MGMNVFCLFCLFWGREKYLIGLKICGRECCVCGFDTFFFWNVLNFPLLIGLKMWVRILSM